MINDGVQSDWVLTDGGQRDPHGLLTNVRECTEWIGRGISMFCGCTRYAFRLWYHGISMTITFVDDWISISILNVLLYNTYTHWLLQSRTQHFQGRDALIVAFWSLFVSELVILSPYCCCIVSGNYYRGVRSMPARTPPSLSNCCLFLAVDFPFCFVAGSRIHIVRFSHCFYSMINLL